jgi:radical SAM superfamily enzyme YgiQ (UPF0313 family)
MKKIVLIQPNFNHGPKSINAYYLPYSIGVLWAYASEVETIKNHYSLYDIIWKREQIDSLFNRIKDADIFAFSTYVWNKNYNYELARRIKNHNANAITVFGGPEIEIESSNFFEKYPFMDFVIKTEGEYTFSLLLENLYNAENIPGLLINKKGKKIDTGPAQRINDLSTIPSPYLSGVFDNIIKENPDVEWNVILETNRGCPYACTFCDWGSLTYNKVKVFPLDRIYQEIEWIAKNKCGFMTIADANFGIFVERDNKITDKIIDVQDKYKFPYAIGMSWAKNQKEDVIGIVKKLTESRHFYQGLTVSVQSMDLSVLENIKRKNLEEHKIEKIVGICEDNGIPTYTELILGLPGETLQGWKNGFYKLFDSGVHSGLEIHQAQLLENAELNLLQSLSYDIDYITVYDYMLGSYANDEIAEGIKVVTSTSTMPYEDMLQAQIYSWFIRTFHVSGMTMYISRFINKFLGISYEEFYESLFLFLSKNKWFVNQKDEITYYYNKWMTEGIIEHPNIGSIEIRGWNLIYRTIMYIHEQNKVAEIFSLIDEFVHQYIGNKKLKNELMNFQMNYFIDFNNLKNYPKSIKYEHDFLSYLRGEELQKQTTVVFDFFEEKNMSKQNFIENIFFLRRKNFGQANVNHFL